MDDRKRIQIPSHTPRRLSPAEIIAACEASRRLKRQLAAAPRPRCPLCQGDMVRTSESRGNVLGIFSAVSLFAVAAFVSLGGLPVIGVPLLILSLFMGGERRRSWRCRQCGAVIPRDKL